MLGIYSWILALYPTAAPAHAVNRMSTPHRLPVRIYAVYLEDVLCQINSDLTFFAAPTADIYTGKPHLFLRLRCLTGLVKLDQFYNVRTFDPPEGPGAVARNKHFARIIEQELRWLDEIAALLPPRTKQISDFTRYAVAVGIRQFGGYLSSLFKRIDTRGDDLGSQRSQLGQNCLEAGQLPATVRSPMPAVEQYDPVLRVQAARQFQCRPIDKIECKCRKDRTRVQLLRHFDSQWQSDYDLRGAFCQRRKP